MNDGDDLGVDAILAAVEQTADDPANSAEFLLDALDRHTGEMSARAFHIFALAFPEATSWPEHRHQRFVDQARDRFDALLLVARQGEMVDDELLTELESVGAAAAVDGSGLPEVLLALRVSRDLVVQMAIDLTDDRSVHQGIALSLLVTRLLPAMDRLTDAIARGYWAEVVRREEESFARYEHVVENSSDGVYEVDLNGIITYANAAFAFAVGLAPDDLIERPLSEVLIPFDGTPLVAPGAPADGGWHGFQIRRADGVVRHVQLCVDSRHHFGALVGHDGVLRDVSPLVSIEQQRSQFLALVTQELRQPVATVLGLGITLGSYADELGAERVRRIGSTISQQAERLARLSDDLADSSHIETDSLLLNPRLVELVPVITASLGMVPGTDRVSISIPTHLRVRADARRLEQVLAHLIENALEHGAPPVVVTAAAVGAGAEIRVIDHGAGYHGDDDRGRGNGGGRQMLGLPLARGLVEAMGGRLQHLANPDGGTIAVVTLPTGT